MSEVSTTALTTIIRCAGKAREVRALAAEVEAANPAAARRLLILAKLAEEEGRHLQRAFVEATLQGWGSPID